MNRRIFFATILLPTVLLLFPADARAQIRPTEETPPEPFSTRFPPAPHERVSRLSRGGEKGESLTKEEKQLLAVPPEDRALYADFLRQSRTGLVRLLPRETFDRKLSLRGGGAYYSFARRVHEYGYGSDIELQRGRLSVGFAGADFGFITDLGDTPLESVTAETDAVRFIADFKVPSAEAEARATSLQFASTRWRRGEGRVEGQQVGGWTYSRSLPAVVGHAYALRSVNYDRSDLLVAFRVLRQDDNGSVVLLWKILEKYPTPALERASR